MSRGIAAMLILVHIVVALYALSRDTGCVELLLVYLAEAVIVGTLAVPKLLITALFGQRPVAPKRARSAIKQFLSMILPALLCISVLIQVWNMLFLVIVTMPSMLSDPSLKASPEAVRPLSTYSSVMAAVGVLTVIHMTSFLADFIGRREFFGASMLRLAAQPLVRTAAIIAVMLIAFIIAIAQSAMSKPTAYTLVIAAIKIAVDISSLIRADAVGNSAPEADINE